MGVNFEVYSTSLYQGPTLDFQNRLKFDRRDQTFEGASANHLVVCRPINLQFDSSRQISKYFDQEQLVRSFCDLPVVLIRQRRSTEMKVIQLVPCRSSQQ